MYTLQLNYYVCIHYHDHTPKTIPTLYDYTPFEKRVFCRTNLPFAFVDVFYAHIIYGIVHKSLKLATSYPSNKRAQACMYDASHVIASYFSHFNNIATLYLMITVLTHCSVNL